MATSPEALKRNAAGLEDFVRTVFGEGVEPDRCRI
jgi:hypothetical protein